MSFCFGQFLALLLVLWRWLPDDSRTYVLEVLGMIKNVKTIERLLSQADSDYGGLSSSFPGLPSWGPLLFYVYCVFPYVYSVVPGKEALGMDSILISAINSLLEPAKVKT